MFMRQGMIGEGTWKIMVESANNIKFGNGSEALRIGVTTKDGMTGSFLIFTNNNYLINKLLNCVYYDGVPRQEEIDIQYFVSSMLTITTKENNGYLNIVDINPFE
ncbi:hypothetical protein [Clostridium sp.]|uniref:hypothetical protein n=1 Tax=Clostridium sp. TaxID=1506 RepID=UPI001A5E4F80|nr:hypothetical protein [Clostridium sp.]MBK5241689.1 hypothetical protein [Clostridium sp.]